MENAIAKKNFVFISYNHKDVKWAKWLQKKLEWYRLPTGIHNELSRSRYIRPIFRDRDNLTSGVLNDLLQKNLESSKFLVVVCSPNSAQSQWVSDVEINTFIKMGRIEHIVPFIIDGIPQDYRNSDINSPKEQECFPLALRQWNLENPDRNILGIAVSDDGKINKQKAFVKLVAHLLGLEFDALWKRHKRYIHRIIASLVSFALVILFLAYWFVIPVKVSITIKDEQSRLPGMEQGTVTVNGSEYNFSRPDTTIEISPLPGYYRLKNVPLTIHTDRFYFDEQASLKIGMGVNQEAAIQLHRDSTFETFAGAIYDASFDNFSNHPIEGAKVTIGKYVVNSDKNGLFCINIPLEEQEEFKPITITKPGYRSFQREDECPNRNLIYLIQHE